MKKSTSAFALLLSILIFSALTALPSNAFAADVFHNESEAGVIIASGNTRTQSYNFKQLNTQTFGKDLIRFEGRLLKLKPVTATRLKIGQQDSSSFITCASTRKL